MTPRPTDEPQSPQDIERLTREIAAWKPEFRDEFTDRLLRAAEYRPFYCPDPHCSGFPHITPHDDEPCDYPYAGGLHPWDPQTPGLCPECGATGTPRDPGWLHYHARPDQRPPNWYDQDILLHLVLSGRGAGKTMSSSRLVHQWVRRVPRLTLIGVTGPTLRRDMVEGPSGILAQAAPDNVPVWEPSKFQLTWPNGAVAYCVSAEEPDRLRGMNTSGIWMDEPAHMKYINEVWDQALLTLRDPGFPAKILATSTPLPSKWVKARVAERRTHLRRVSTYANLHTLSKTFRDQILDRYEGTRLGQQELHGEVLADIEGALFRVENFQYPEAFSPSEIADLPLDTSVAVIPTRADFKRVVVGVDPAGTASRRSDETGIVVAAVDHKGRFWVLSDVTGKYSPNGWASQVQKMVDVWEADAVVAEQNYGGDMVRTILEQADIFARIDLVHSLNGKELRAEPIAGRYERKEVWHMRGLEKLEEEMTTWVPGKGRSPNRIDATVFALTDLYNRTRRGSVEIASPLDLPEDVANDALIDSLYGTSDATLPSGLVVPASAASVHP